MGSNYGAGEDLVFCDQLRRWFMPCRCSVERTYIHINQFRRDLAPQQCAFNKLAKYRLFDSWRRTRGPSEFWRLRSCLNHLSVYQFRFHMVPAQRAFEPLVGCCLLRRWNEDCCLRTTCRCDDFDRLRRDVVPVEYSRWTLGHNYVFSRWNKNHDDWV